MRTNCGLHIVTGEKMRTQGTYHIEEPGLAKTPSPNPSTNTPSKTSRHIDMSGMNRCLQGVGGLSKELDVPKAGAMFTNMPAIALALVMGTILAVVHQEWGRGCRVGVVTC